MALLKKILIVVGPIVLIVGLYLMMSGGPRLPSSVTLVDIRTGKIERLSYRSVTSYPWKSSEDGARVMLPVQRNEDGAWLVPARYHEAIAHYYREHGDGAVDLNRNGLVANPIGP